MILSISRRTDIPAFYTDWLVNRFKEGYVLVRNPMNYHQVSRVAIKPDLIDCIVFWTKDPQNIIGHLDLFSDYNYYFQITINPYGSDIEKGVRPVDEIIQSIKVLSNLIGPQRIIWRYDPIILSDQLDIAYHVGHFRKMMEELHPYCHKCLISFMDVYSKTSKNMSAIQYRIIKDEDMITIAYRLSKIANQYHMPLETCSESVDLSAFGIGHGKCIDDRLISILNKGDLVLDKDKNQRDLCGCVTSIDIGAYNTCNHKCIYCYANYSEGSMTNKVARHDPESAFLIGDLEKGDVIIERKMEKYYKDYNQLKMDI